MTDQLLGGLPTPVEAEQTDIRRWFAVLRSRWQLFVGTLTAGLVLVALVTWLWPATYRSSAVILIEQQEIPQEIVRSTVTAYADERLQVITQRIMTTPTLVDLMNRFDLYAVERRREPQEQLLERIRDDIGLDVISADVNDPRSGRPVEATIAFELSFSYRSPQVAHRVANELVTLYQQENRRVRNESVDSTAAFLAQEAEKLRQRIETLEARLAKFKARHVTDLPELFSVNVELMHRTEREIDEVLRDLRAVQDRRALLNATLAQALGQEELGDVRSRLVALQGELAAAVAVYGDAHPDVQRLRRQVESMSGTVASSGRLSSELVRRRAELADLRSRYSDQHPDVLRLEEQVAALERQRAEELPAPAGEDTEAGLIEAATSLAGQSPGIASIVAQLEAAQAEESGLRAQLAELRTRMEQYRARLEQSPLVESEYRTLTRDYDNELYKYREIKNKLLEAQLAQSLESNQQAERFTVLEYPTPPEQPETPNRTALLFVGVVLALAASVCGLAIAESVDQTVRGPAAMAEALGITPMALIPVISTPAQQTSRKRTVLVALLAGIAAMVLGAIVVHQLLLPLDTAVLLIMRRLGL